MSLLCYVATGESNVMPTADYVSFAYSPRKTAGSNRAGICQANKFVIDEGANRSETRDESASFICKHVGRNIVLSCAEKKRDSSLLSQPEHQFFH